MKKSASFLAKTLLLSFFFMTIAPVVVPILSSDALASTATAEKNVLVTTMCNALSIITGSAGKAFAAFAIISVGIGFFTGKVSWGLMIGVAAGIAAMFGAPSIVSAISGTSEFECAE